uniref:Uncharacterized protein n=1 Tax=Manihot esculenta TaxID=3983 RepID=A0A2C9UDN5_MANES
MLVSNRPPNAKHYSRMVHKQSKFILASATCKELTCVFIVLRKFQIIPQFSGLDFCSADKEVYLENSKSERQKF